jgi:hypothetical protein
MTSVNRVTFPMASNVAARCLAHEPSLRERAWWQPRASRRDVDLQLIKSFEHAKCAFGERRDVDLWQLDTLGDALPVAIVRESSSAKGMLALAKLDGGRVRHALVQPLWLGDALLGFYCQVTEEKYKFTRTISELVDTVSFLWSLN